jgi:hypothetical protein
VCRFHILPPLFFPAAFRLAMASLATCHGLPGREGDYFPLIALLSVLK